MAANPYLVSRELVLPSWDQNVAKADLMGRVKQLTTGGAGLWSTVASAQSEAPQAEEDAPQTGGKRRKGEEGDALREAQAMEEDPKTQEEIAAIEAALKGPTSEEPIAVGQKLSVLDETGKIQTLIPRFEEQKSGQQQLDKIDDPIDFTNVPEALRPEWESKVRAERELKIKKQMEKMLQEERLRDTLEEVQNMFNTVVVPAVKSLNPADKMAESIDPIKRGIQESVDQRSVNSLNAVRGLIQTMASAGKSAHSTLQKSHDLTIRVQQDNKHLRKILQEKENRLKQMEDQLREAQERAMNPMFSKTNERVTPVTKEKEKGDPTAQAVAITKTEAKRSRGGAQEEEEENPTFRVMRETIKVSPYPVNENMAMSLAGLVGARLKDGGNGMTTSTFAY